MNLLLLFLLKQMRIIVMISQHHLYENTIGYSEKGINLTMSLAVHSIILIKQKMVQYQ